MKIDSFFAELFRPKGKPVAEQNIGTESCEIFVFVSFLLFTERLEITICGSNDFTARAQRRWRILS